MLMAQTADAADAADAAADAGGSDPAAVETGVPEYGPAFNALTVRQKKFVLMMASAPLESAASWARSAGYSDASGRAKTTASELLGNEAVRAAIFTAVLLPFPSVSRSRRVSILHLSLAVRSALAFLIV